MSRSQEWSIAIRYMNKPCPICNELFAGPNCGHKVADLLAHERQEVKQEQPND